MINVMTEARRLKILTIAGDMLEKTGPILHFFDSFAQRELIFDWLLKNQIKGAKLMEMHNNMQHSPLRMANYILKKIQADRIDGIKVGRDWNAH